MSKLFSIYLSFLLTICIILVGCSSTSSTTLVATSPAITSKPPTTQLSVTETTTKPKSGGTLTMLLVGEPFSLYPPTMTGQVDGQTSNVCLETLFIYDNHFNLVPLLATGWMADTAAKTITITLRKGVKFQDGSDFNANVCKWNLDQYRMGNRPELKQVSSVDVIDTYTVRLNLATFDNTIVTNLSNSSDAGRMISRQSFDANGGKDWAAQNPVGTGPFQFVSWKKSIGITWKRFDNYWGGKPYLDVIQMKQYADPTVILMDFQAGNLDLNNGLTPLDAINMKKSPEKYTVVVTPYGLVIALAGYAADPASPFSKLAVRQAMSYAIDVKTWATSLGLGFWQIQNSWALPGTATYNNEIQGYPYNPDKAKALLTSAGYTLPLKTTLNFFSTSQTSIDSATVIQSYLNAGGFDVTLNPLQKPAFVDIASNGKGWSGILQEQGFISPDPLVKYAGSMGGQEFKGMYLPQELTDAYHEAVIAPDQNTKETLTKRFLSLATDKYCIATYFALQSTLVSKSIVVKDDLYGQYPFNYLSPMTWVNR
jgi:peptide/nickel transport system substrate-binding protein